MQGARGFGGTREAVPVNEGHPWGQEGAPSTGDGNSTPAPNQLSWSGGVGGQCQPEASLDPCQRESCGQRGEGRRGHPELVRAVGLAPPRALRSVLGVFCLLQRGSQKLCPGGGWQLLTLKFQEVPRYRAAWHGPGHRIAATQGGQETFKRSSTPTLKAFFAPSLSRLALALLQLPAPGMWTRLVSSRLSGAAPLEGSARGAGGSWGALRTTPQRRAAAAGNLPREQQNPPQNPPRRDSPCGGWERQLLGWATGQVLGGGLEGRGQLPWGGHGARQVLVGGALVGQGQFRSLSGKAA